MNKAHLVSLEHEWQVNALISELSARGIEYEVRKIPREYSSIITGLGGPTFHISVTREQFISAKNIFNRLEQSTSNTLLNDETPKDQTEIEKNYFKRVIWLSILGVVILPLIANILATYNFTLMLKKMKLTNQMRTAAFLILILGWIFAVGTFYLFVQT